MSETFVRVMRNPASDAENRWLVVCAACSHNDGSGMLEFLAAFGSKGKWKAHDWATAQTFAVSHARQHESTRCPTCHQLPADRDLPTWKCGLCGVEVLLVGPAGERMEPWEADLRHECPVRSGAQPARGASA